MSKRGGGGRKEERRRKRRGSEEGGRSTNLQSNERLGFCRTPSPLQVFSGQTLDCGPRAVGGRNILRETTIQRVISYL